MGWRDWLSLRKAGPSAERWPAWPTRWIVLDVESTGLDSRRDHLLAVAAVAVHLGDGGDRIVLGDSFDAVLQHDPHNAEPDRSNILLHGIGVGRQRSGLPRAQALAAFEAWAGGSPLIAFHAAFDRAMIERARRELGLAALPNPWLDLEPLAAVLRRDIRARSLDEWMAALGIVCAVRHQAAADTLATAELLLRVLPALRHAQLAAQGAASGAPPFAAVQELAEQRRWLPD
jgi:DNA polymerase III subunit epsilon